MEGSFSNPANVSKHFVWLRGVNKGYLCNVIGAFMLRDQVVKNIQIIDGALNCTFSLFQATEEEFRVIFPGAGQDIEFAEDLFQRIGENSRFLDPIWERPIAKPDANGIHGSLFFDFGRKRHLFPATKRERDWDPSALNAAQRRL